MWGHLNVGPPTLFADLLLHAGVNEPFHTHKKCTSRSREVEKETGRAVLGALNKKYFLQHVHKMSNYTGGGGGRRGGFSEGKRASRTFLFANSAVKLGFAVMGLRGFAVIHEARCSHAALMRREEGRLEEQRAAVKITRINQITSPANRNRKHRPQKTSLPVSFMHHIELKSLFDTKQKSVDRRVSSPRLPILFGLGAPSQGN